MSTTQFSGHLIVSLDDTPPTVTVRDHDAGRIFVSVGPAVSGGIAIFGTPEQLYNFARVLMVEAEAAMTPDPDPAVVANALTDAERF